MLHLAVPTDPAWAAYAVGHLDEILVDHTHCEKKAASTAVSLLFRYPEEIALLPALSQLAREELVHFEAMLAHLATRGVHFRHQVPSAYAAALLRAVRPQEPLRLLDTLLCMALIEARSCERMQLIAEATNDAGVRELYRGLLASEARHHHTYVDLAATVAPAIVARARLAELATHEGAVLAASGYAPRLHG